MSKNYFEETNIEKVHSPCTFWSSIK